MLKPNEAKQTARQSPSAHRTGHTQRRDISALPLSRGQNAEAQEDLRARDKYGENDQDDAKISGVSLSLCGCLSKR